MPVAESRNRSALKPTIKRNWKALLAAAMAINHPRRRRRIGINDKVILLADPLHFADVMIELPAPRMLSGIGIVGKYRQEEYLNVESEPMGSL